ncbi:hypothetical protein QV06_11370 [Gallibacterium genomosp. 3]|uniref:Uncharacterized protein n=1 Tax=Gallibacterium genomosp. 3 TaxID=505345 RepID=A0A1A7PJF4_9PAST|nr:hypothetical protein [Gallibacterium genomosp. 3]OBX01812.1 hypothetical protein QV06_11370 [Gallibacterium genomosp. 3]
MNEFSTFFVLAMIGFKRIFAFILLLLVGMTYWYFGSALIDLIPLSNEHYRGFIICANFTGYSSNIMCYLDY